jgi:cell filamentation protein
MPESLDPYTYPGTDVLRNIPDIRVPHRLAGFEANATAARLAELDARPLNGSFDSNHLKAVHWSIFQDVYSWAGEFRTVNLSKGGHLFALTAFIEPALEQVLSRLHSEKQLIGYDGHRFAQRAGFYLGEINAIHPFRDGNGRAQREFLRQLGLHAGFVIDWRKTTPEEMIAASRTSAASGDSSELGALIQICIS